MTARNQAGFTLVEILIVLAILGAVTGIAVISMGNHGSNGGAEYESRRLAGQLRLAADEALVTGRPLTFNWDDRGYAFSTWDPKLKKWQADPTTLLGKRHEFRAQLQMSTDADGNALRINPDGIGNTIVLTLLGSSQQWTVKFDGFDIVLTQVR